MHAAIILGLGILPALVLPLGWFWWSGVISDAVCAVVLVLFGMCAVGWLAWLFALPAPSPVTIGDGFVDVPWGRGRRRMALPEVLLCRLEHKTLSIFAASAPGAAPVGDVGSVVLSRRDFVDDDGPLELVGAIRAAMHAIHPGLVARLDENEARQRAFFQRRPVVIIAAAGICAVGFVVEVATGAIGDGIAGAAGLIHLGANSSLRVGAFEVWRLVTANLLHGSLIHIGMNLAALLTTGAVVERWLGRPATLIVLTASGVAGQGASAAIALAEGVARVSVGISGAVFGVLGVLLVSSFRYRRQSTGGMRVPASTWLLLLITNAAISMIPMVDVAAHAGGLVAGVCVALVVSPRPHGPPMLTPRQQLWLAGVAGAAIVVSLICLAVSVATAGA